MHDGPSSVVTKVREETQRRLVKEYQRLSEFDTQLRTWLIPVTKNEMEQYILLLINNDFPWL